MMVNLVDLTLELPSQGARAMRDASSLDCMLHTRCSSSWMNKIMDTKLMSGRRFQSDLTFPPPSEPDQPKLQLLKPLLDSHCACPAV
jgi:hypothetical protein